MRMQFGPGLSPGQLIELAALIILFPLALFAGGSLRHWARRVNALLDSLARRRFLSCAICFALPIALRLLILPIYPAPEPQIHDDYSFILQARTFAQFHVTNPPLQPGDPIEEQYVLSRPTRQSIYPPGQALLLALSILVFRSAWAGVLLATGLMCGLLCWSLRQWISARWAFRVALYAALFIGVLSHWPNSYVGGSVNAIGGLLMWGAMPRLARAPKTTDAVIFSLGFLIGIDTRPVESFLFAAIAVVWIAWNLLARRRAAVGSAVPAFAAAAVCVASGVILNCIYNARVTGNPLEPGYVAAQKSLGVPQNFYFQRAVQPASFDFPDIRAEYLRQTGLWRRGRSLGGFTIAAAGKLKRAWTFFVGVALTPVLFAIPRSLRSRGVVLALVFFAALLAVHLFYHSYYPHYDACISGPIALLLIQGWRHLRLWKPGGNALGLALCRAIPIAAFAGLIAPVTARVADGPPAPGKWYATEFNYAREPRQVLDRFAAMPGKMLLLIRYSPKHHPDDDWIFNDPDPAASKIVIARENGEESDAALLRRFPGRQCWLVDADSRPPRARPCQPQLLAGN